MSAGATDRKRRFGLQVVDVVRGRNEMGHDCTQSALRPSRAVHGRTRRSACAHRQECPISLPSVTVTCHELTISVWDDMLQRDVAVGHRLSEHVQVVDARCPLGVISTMLLAKCHALSLHSHMSDPTSFLMPCFEPRQRTQRCPSATWLSSQLPTNGLRFAIARYSTAPTTVRSVASAQGERKWSFDPEDEM